MFEVIAEACQGLSENLSYSVCMTVQNGIDFALILSTLGSQPEKLAVNRDNVLGVGRVYFRVEKLHHGVGFA